MTHHLAICLASRNNERQTSFMANKVQSLSSPFFPPLIGAEPGREKRQSRITCKRMLKTDQSKITKSQPRCSRQCVEQCLFQLALWKKKFLWRWYCGKKHKNRNTFLLLFFCGLCSYRQQVRDIAPFPNVFLFVLFLRVERVCKSFWKESLKRISSSFA